MDFLHAKAALDQHLKTPRSADEFYEQHSCDWLHVLRSFGLNKGSRPIVKLYDLVHQS